MRRDAHGRTFVAAFVAIGTAADPHNEKAPENRGLGGILVETRRL